MVMELSRLNVNSALGSRRTQVGNECGSDDLLWNAENPGISQLHSGTDVAVPVGRDDLFYRADQTLQVASDPEGDLFWAH